MTKIYIKLIAMALALILSVSVVIMSSYAWMVLSGNPAVSGIQVAIGGGNTILVAPNVTATTEDGKSYNVPGHFSDKMNFAVQDSYAYLTELGGLSPVSTANGIDWYLSETKVDCFLEYANLKAGDEKLEEGSYVYLDFWVVSPGGDYFLRVSAGDENSGGSYVVDLPTAEESDGSYILVNPESKAAAAVRIGFLANDAKLTDDSMLAYTDSFFYDKRFTALKGWYQEPNTGTVAYYPNDSFTIYEPNGDSHPADESLDGSYVLTTPRSSDENYDPWSNLIVQFSSKWTPSGNGTHTMIEEQFQTYIMGKDISDEQEAMTGFYGKHLQGLTAPYVTKGDFIKSTDNLKNSVGTNGTVSADKLSVLQKAGAATDRYIVKLEQNVPQRIRMFIWIEAADVDCEAIGGTASFAVNIELAGGNE